MKAMARHSAAGGQHRAGFGAQPAIGRALGFAVVIVLHIAIVYALVNGLARHAVDVVRAPIETTIIDEAPQRRTEPPPPPRPQLAPPPAPFVPPPEVHIETPPPAPVQSTAPAVVTTVRPVAPPPPAEPVRVPPRLDVEHSEEAEYPPVSRRLGEQGSVILRVLIGTDGRVQESQLLQSSGFDRLDQAALAGVKRRYRFVPGTVDGRPEPMWYTFKFTWKLR